MSKRNQTEAPQKQQGEDPPLRILYLENDLNDFNLVVRWFKTENVAAVFKRVETREEFLENLTGFAPDVILLDYHLPQFDALEALQVLQDRQSDIATVLFTGAVGEEQAIECLRLGVDDYVTKQYPARLIPAILGAIEKKRTEEDFRKKAEELDRYFNGSLDLLCIADTGGRFLRLNPEWEKTLGYPLQELIGKKFFDLVHPDDLPATLEAVSTLASQKEVLNFENRYRHRNGTYRWIEWRSYPEGDKIFAVARDITERKEANQKLREAERMLSETGRIAKIGGWEFDVETGKGNWTEEVARIHDMDPGEETSVTVSLSFYTGESKKMIEEALREAIEDNKPYDIELELTTGKGKHRWVRTIGQPVSNGTKVVQLKGSLQDITARKQTEKELVEKETQYRSLFENMTEGFAYCRMIFQKNEPVDYIYLLVNTQFELQTGLKDVIGKAVTEIIPGIKESSPELFERLGKVALTGKPDRFEMFLETLDLWFSLSVYCPQKEYFIAVFDVINERKQAEKKLLDQLNELHRWQKLMEGREERNRELKREVNELLQLLGKEKKYHTDAF